MCHPLTPSACYRVGQGWQLYSRPNRREGRQGQALEVLGSRQTSMRLLDFSLVTLGKESVNFWGNLLCLSWKTRQIIVRTSSWAVDNEFYHFEAKIMESYCLLELTPFAAASLGILSTTPHSHTLCFWVSSLSILQLLWAGISTGQRQTSQSC